LGNKIVLWGDGNTAHYGLGVQSGLLQIHSDLPGTDIIFGTGSSSLFKERMRINTLGGDGLNINGRIILKNGTTPLDLNYGSGVWMYKADNSALLGFMGVQNNQNLGFYGGPAGWGFTYDAINSRVGIGNNTPANTLDVVGTTSTSNLVLAGTGNGNTNDFLIKSNSTGLVSARKGHGAAALNYIICTSGVFPGNGSPGSIDFAWLGEVKLFAGSYVPLGWEFCNGQLLSIENNTALFAIIGIEYGGNGSTNFALPDLRGATPVGFGTPAGGGNTWVLGERTQ
jgi:microcystin-dependent protein